MTYIKIATTSFTASSAVNIDNVFSASYTHYLVVRNLLGSGTNENIKVRLRVGGADDSGANYREQYVDAGSTSVSGGRVTGQTSWLAAMGVNETTAFGYALLRISNPFEAVRTTAWADFTADADANIALQRRVMAHDLTTSYTGLTVIPTAGTITGSITVYGLKAS